MMAKSRRALYKLNVIPPDKCIDGRALADSILQSLSQKVSQIPKKNPKPSLHFVIAGDDPASHVYVSNKKKACEKVGFLAIDHRLPEKTTKDELLQLIDKLNHDRSVHGMLLQLPLPKHLDENLCLNAIDPLKDIDGFHVLNVGKLWNRRRQDNHIPCTALGILKLIQSIPYDLEGKHCVVVGQSPIVGRPTSAVLALQKSTVTMCHKFSTPLSRYTLDADVLVVATGVKHLVNEGHVKKGAIVIDVGIHRTPNGIVGDVDVASVVHKVSKITPVPGGVGPMTIACLLENTWNAYEQLTKNSSLS